MPSRSDLSYALCRYVLIGPALRLLGRPRIVGREHIPRTGAVILAANHLAVSDSFYLALAARRPTMFLAKAEYFEGTGTIAAVRRRFLHLLGQIPVDRRGGHASAAALDAAVDIVSRGGAWGIHPEGTRSPDGRLYRGRTGAVRVALETGTPLVPVAITGTARHPSVTQQRRRVVVRILPPMDLTLFRDMGSPGVRAATDTLMRTIGGHTGQEQVDEYAKSWTQ
ncbi:1-acyl-sn-glycerol-3-phosphate acyltransferase [Prescottella sp. R16]|uniref:lysophospholipid acyltransferase family protein n=1 Tax=Prescottella sp. R16 TaxID=3064529 RepID=UPI00272EC7C7|nr:lysophospholipid acyltransferase family protein [Prescottella sp. R16]